MHTYDAISQLTAISDGSNTLASFNRIGWRPKTTTFQSGATATTSYTGFRNEVASIHHQTNAPATILRLDYGYNKVRDRTYERFGGAGSPGAPTSTTSCAASRTRIWGSIRCCRMPNPTRMGPTAVAESGW